MHTQAEHIHIPHGPLHRGFSVQPQSSGRGPSSRVRQELRSRLVCVHMHLEDWPTKGPLLMGQVLRKPLPKPDPAGSPVQEKQDKSSALGRWGPPETTSGDTVLAQGGRKGPWVVQGLPETQVFGSTAPGRGMRHRQRLVPAWAWCGLLAPAPSSWRSWLPGSYLTVCFPGTFTSASCLGGGGGFRVSR